MRKSGRIITSLLLALIMLLPMLLGGCTDVKEMAKQIYDAKKDTPAAEKATPILSPETSPERTPEPEEPKDEPTSSWDDLNPEERAARNAEILAAIEPVTDNPYDTWELDIPMEVQENCEGTRVPGHYHIAMPLTPVVGPGPVNTDAYRYHFSDSSITYTVLVAHDLARISEEEFRENWPKYQTYMAQRGKEIYGDHLKDISFEIQSWNGIEVYTCFFTVSDDKTSYDFTSSFRFNENYTVEYLGYGSSENPELSLIPIMAALLFENLTPKGEEPILGIVHRGTYSKDPGEWILPTNNIFAVAYEVTEWQLDRNIEPEGKPIKWSNPQVEAIARAVLNKDEDEDIYQNELDLITDLTLHQNEASAQYCDVSTGRSSWMVKTGEVKTLVDLQYLRNVDDLRVNMDLLEDLNGLEGMSKVKNLHLEAPQVKDIGPLGGMTSIQELLLMSLHGDLNDLSPLGNMQDLRSVMLWGYPYPGVKDVSFFRNCAALNDATLFLPSVKNIDVFAELPVLTKLLLIVDPSTDTSKVVANEKIESLIINATDLRERKSKAPI